MVEAWYGKKYNSAIVEFTYDGILPIIQTPTINQKNAKDSLKEVKFIQKNTKVWKKVIAFSALFNPTFVSLVIVTV